MLQKMRDRMQGLITIVIVGLICLTFALWGIQNYTKSTHASNFIAKVNGIKIPRTKLLAHYERIKRQEMAREGSSFLIDQKGQAEVKRQITHNLIEIETINQALEKLRFGIGSDQLALMVVRNPTFLVDNKFDSEKFRRYLESMLFTEEEFFHDVTYTIISNQMRIGIIASAFTLPLDVEVLTKYLKQKRDIGYFTVAANSFVKNIEVKVSEIKNYYDSHKQEFLIPEKVSIEYVQLNADEIKHKIVVNNEVLEKFYHDNIATYSTPKRWKVNRILIPLSDDAAAKDVIAAETKLKAIIDQTKKNKNSQSIVKNGGTVTWITSAEVSPVFVEHLAKLKIGEVSEPIRTKEGYNLVQLLETQLPKAATYNEARATVKKAYEQQRIMQLFAELNDKLADLTYTNSDSLKSAANALGLDIKTTKLFTATGSKDGLEKNPKIIKAAFSEQVLKQNFNSNPLEIAAGNIVVLRIKQHIPETIMPLDSVKDVIKQKIYLKNLAEKNFNIAQDVLRILQAGSKPIEIEKKYHLKWKTLNNVSYDFGKLNKKIMQKIFELPVPILNKPSATIVEVGNGEYVVVQVFKITAGKAKEMLPIEQQKLSSQLQTMFGNFDYFTWVDELIKQAKVEIADEGEKS
jgi:peptidyl-prolyl cis-trans isomerase D